MSFAPMHAIGICLARGKDISDYDGHKAGNIMRLALGVFLYQSTIGKCRKYECGECPVTHEMTLYRSASHAVIG